MLTKEFLDSKVDSLLHDYMLDELGTTIQLLMPTNYGSSTKEAYSINAFITNLSKEDSERLSIEDTEFKTVDLFKQDLLQLREDNPTKFILVKNLQKNVVIVIDNKEFKIREERDKQGFKNIIRLICERQTM